MMDRTEKRKYHRLGAKFGISCRKIGSSVSQSHEGYTINISPGGMYLRTTSDIFQRGDLLKVELRLLPTSSFLEFGGKMEAFARVLRTDNKIVPPASDELSGNSYGVALQFCRPPKLCI